VEQEEIDAILQQWRSDMAFKAPAERPSQTGDFLVVTITGRLDGDTVFEERDLELPLTSEGATAAGLPTAVVEELVGLAPGGDRSFTLEYPEFWKEPELQGQEVSFEAHAASVSAMKLPDLDNDLAREIGGVATLEELRDRVKAQIMVRKALEERDRYVGEALDALVGQSTLSYAPALLEAEVASVIADLKSRVERQGFTWERWLELSQKTEESLWDEIEPQARERLERALVLGAFARAENVTVSRQEVDEEVRRLGEAVFEETGRRIRPSDTIREDTASRMRTGHALDRLVAIASGELDVASAAREAAEEEEASQ
jgi:trigger factor